MRLDRIFVKRHRSVSSLEFDLGSFTVLFGKNDAGKTNLLEAMYGILAPREMPGLFDKGTAARGIRRGDETELPPLGALKATIEAGLPFDDAIRDIGPPNVESVWFVGTNSIEENDLGTGLAFSDRVRDCINALDDYLLDEPEHEELLDLCAEGPSPRPLFLGWEFDDVDDFVTTELLGHFDDPSEALARKPSLGRWLEPVDSCDGQISWRINPRVSILVNTLGLLATDFLPDFIDGQISASLRMANTWGAPLGIEVRYQARGSTDWHPLNDLGRGAARWTAIAVQVALHLMTKDPSNIVALLGLQTEGVPANLSGNVLFVDEPEAHLHPTAVASVVRWCQRMVRLGCNVVAASHHEEFLRASQGVTFVKVTRETDPALTKARTLRSATTPLLQDLAQEVGMHPAIALSLHRAMLFVEGPLDEAVLDEFAAPELDAAGVTIFPIHGTKNLEGLIDGEFATRLSIKAGILTDKTDVATIWDRSQSKRSGEEKKIARLVKRYEDLGLPPPTPFGVPEDDLLFALPADAIRDLFNDQFPGWSELVKECREADGLGLSDSPDWKSYALSHYGLHLNTSEGVRSVVRALDLAGVELPSVRAVVDEIIAWAAD